MRIIYVTSQLSNQGPINQMYNLINNMDFNIYEIIIVTIYEESTDSRKAEFEKLGIKIDCLNVVNKWEYPKMIWSLNKKIKFYNPDIIHAEGMPADIITSFQKGTCVCTTVHCNIYADYFSWLGKKFPKNIIANLFIKVHESSLKKKHSMICCSEYLKQIYDRHSFKSVVAVQNGVNCQKNFVLTPKDKNLLKQELKLDLTSKIVLIVGTLDERKDTLTIVNAANQMDDVKNVQFVFLGDGNMRKQCEEQCKNKKVIFAGKVNNVEQYLECSDIYVSASKSEGLPMSVLEAGLHGLKLILSDIPQHKEITMYAKKDVAQFFAIGDYLELSRILRTCDYDQLNEQEKIKEYFVNHFSSKIMADKYCKLYEGYIKENGSGIHI